MNAAKMRNMLGVESIELLGSYSTLERLALPRTILNLLTLTQIAVRVTTSQMQRHSTFHTPCNILTEPHNTRYLLAGSQLKLKYAYLV